MHRFYEQQPNLTHRAQAPVPDQIWVGDITNLAVADHWCYLTVILDQCWRRVLECTLTRPRDGHAPRAQCGRRPPSGLIFHGDRGSEYLAAQCRDRLVRLGIALSANTRGPGDNAHMQSFLHTLTIEVTRTLTFASAHALRISLRRYLWYYNHEPAHSALRFQSPVEYEAHAA